MAVQIALLVVLSVAAAARVWVALHAKRDKTLRLLLALGLVLLATGQTLSLPPITSATDLHLSAGVGKVAYNLATMGGLGALLWFFTRMTQPRSTRALLAAHTIALALCAGAMIALMAATPPEHRHHSLQSSFAGLPQIPWFYLVGGAYFTYAYALSGWYVWRYSSNPTKRISVMMRWALRVIAVAELGLAATAVGRETWVAAKYVTGVASEWAGTLNWQLSNISLIGMTAGLTLLVAAGTVDTVRLLIGRIRQYRDMALLWTELKGVYPEVVLRRRLRDWFHRRVIECLDGLARLSPYIGEAAKETDLSRCGPPELARYVWTGLTLKPTLESTNDQLPAVALPLSNPQDPDADVEQLVALAVAFRDHRP